MGYLKDRSVEEAVKESIMESLKNRDLEMCDTWNRDKALAEPYGIRIDLDPSEVSEVGEGIERLGSGELLIEDIRVEVVKADVRERKGKATLILRYRHIEGY